MTENKLTLEDILKYHKAKVIPADKGEWAGWISDIHIKSKSLTVILKGHFPEIEMGVNISDCKLILRDISQLTDAEKIYINDNLFYELFKNTVSLNANAVWNSLDELLAVCGDKTALIDYLRSISVDIDGMIASGKAVRNSGDFGQQ